MSRDLRTGWTSAILLHVLLFLIAFIYQLPEIVRAADFIEMQWGTVASAAPKREPTPPVEKPEARRPVKSSVNPSVKTSTIPAKKPAVRTPNLPERRLPDMTDEVLSVPNKGEKIASTPEGGVPRIPERSMTDRMEQSPDSRAQPDVVGDRALPSSTGAGAGNEGPGSGAVGSDLGYTVQWTGGGTRRRISGKLPEYPEGTNVRAQVRIRGVVQPDGAIRSVSPIQKANSSLEEAAMSELRLWKFEPLRSGVPQVDQECVVTFLFTLR